MNPEWPWIPAQGFASTIDEEVAGLTSMPPIRFNKNINFVKFESDLLVVETERTGRGFESRSVNGV